MSDRDHFDFEENHEIVDTPRIEHLRRIQPHAPFVDAYISHNQPLIQQFADYVSRAGEVHLSLTTNGGLGSPLMCDAFEEQLNAIMPSADVHNDKWGQFKNPNLEIHISNFKHQIEFRNGRVEMSLEEARLLLPKVYSEDQVDAIDGLLGLSEHENNLALTCVTTREVNSAKIRDLLDRGTFDRVVIIPHDPKRAESMERDLQSNGVSVGRLSEDTTGQVLIIDTHGIAGTVLQSRSIKASIVGWGHNPTESLMAGCETVMLPKESYKITSGLARDSGQLSLVGSNERAWDKVSRLKKSNKNFTFRNKLLRNYFKNYSDLITKIMKTLMR